jgi:uncharacterized protein YuzE
MKLTHDKTTGVAYLTLRKGKFSKTRVVTGGQGPRWLVTLDLDDNEGLLGIEIISMETDPRNRRQQTTST